MKKKIKNINYNFIKLHYIMNIFKQYYKNYNNHMPYFDGKTP